MKPIASITDAAAALNLSPGQVQGAVMDILHVPTALSGVGRNHGEHLSDAEIEDKWGIGRAKMRKLTSNPDLLDSVHAAMTENGMVLVGLLQESVLDDLMDPVKLAQMSTIDKTRALKAAVEAVTTLKDGHAKPVTFNLGDAMKLTEQLKSAKAELTLVEKAG